MTVTVYVEGGGDGPDGRRRCRQGFAEYCRKVAPDTRIKIVACGPRGEAYSKFRIAVGIGKADQRNSLLVDSEEPVPPDATPAIHLGRHDRWNFADLPTPHVFLMVQAMEAWFFADRAALAAYYGEGFRLNALRGDERHIERIAKSDLEPCLVNASRDTRTKETYHKTRHAFDLLSRIDPNKVEASSAHAQAFHGFLRSA